MTGRAGIRTKMNDSVLAPRLRAALSADEGCARPFCGRSDSGHDPARRLRAAPRADRQLGGAEEWQHDPRVSHSSVVLEGASAPGSVADLAPRWTATPPTPCVTSPTRKWSRRSTTGSARSRPSTSWSSSSPSRAVPTPTSTICRAVSGRAPGAAEADVGANYWDEMGRGIAPLCTPTPPPHRRRRSAFARCRRTSCRSRRWSAAPSTDTSPPTVVAARDDRQPRADQVPGGAALPSRRHRPAPARRPDARCPSTPSMQPPTRDTARTGSTGR